jgi:hypothetical protein
MKTKYANGTAVSWLFAPVLLILTGCSQTVWVNAGATDADSQVAMDRCLSTAYLQAPSAPTIATIGSDVASPSFTTCSGRGSNGSCITSRGRYTRPLTIRTDANARIRTQLFRQCMNAAGWSEQARSNPATMEAPDDDWTRGFDVGFAGGSAEQCAAPPSGTGNGTAWSLGCRSGQNAR